MRRYNRTFALLEKEEWNMSFVRAVRRGRGMYLKPNVQMKKKKMKKKVNKHTEESVDDVGSPLKTLYSENPYEEMGR